MLPYGTLALILGGALSAAAAGAHLVCIFIGAPAYRFLGAGEKMARAAEAGKAQPTLVTLAITGLLFVWAAYAFSGAGVIRELPLRKLALIAIASVYMARALAFLFLKSAFPDNSARFWLVSSSICLVIGLLHVYGLVARWSSLKGW
jgi:hypothetical protein